MPLYSDFVRDDYGRPISGATAKLFAINGSTLIDTDVTGFDGQFTVGFPDDQPGAKCILQVSYGTASERSVVLVGDPPEYAGPPGAADNTYALLAAFKASDITRKTASLVGVPGVSDGRFNWTLGNFTGQADNVNIVKSDSATLTTGAWVRQSTQSLTNQQDGINSVQRSAQSKANDIINALDKGVMADGVTDDRVALQAAIDVASNLGRPLQLPYGTIMIGAPGLDFRGRAVDMRGVPNRTTIKALASMATLINAEETVDTYHTPFNVQDVYLDGDNKVTNANLSIRYRHGYDLTSIFSYNAFRAFRERDCYLSRHWNLRTGTCQLGYHIEGSNHSSLYAGCSAIGASAAGILIEAFGAVADGNHALMFQACDVEFGDGDGVIIGAGTSADFEGCYLGEAIGQSVIRNLGGTVKINGGVCFWGYNPSSALCRPAGGRTKFRGTRLAAQTSGGISNLVYLTDAELAGDYGRVSYEDIEGYLPVGGNPVIKGDPLDFGPQYRNFVPRTGRVFTTETNNVTITASFPSPNAVRATCASVTDSNPTMGFSAPLNTTDWRVAEPFYLVMIYKSNKPVAIKLSESALGPTIFSLGTAPSSVTTSTYVKLDSLSPAIASGVLEIQINNVAAGDFLELIEVYFTDSTMHKQSMGNLGALYKC